MNYFKGLYIFITFFWLLPSPLLLGCQDPIEHIATIVTLVDFITE